VSLLPAPRHIVLVGTGTSVGKTWVACELLRELRRRAIPALGLKPVESGVTGTIASDAEELARLSAWRPTSPPYQLVEALSPHLAARRANRTIDGAEILRYVRSHKSSQAGGAADVLVVETAGGLFSPLDESSTNWDVARALDPSSWVLVAPDALGVLHDVTATLAAAAARGRSPDRVVLSAARAPDASTGTNAAELQRLGLVPQPFALGRHDSTGIVGLVDALLGA